MTSIVENPKPCHDLEQFGHVSNGALTQARWGEPAVASGVNGRGKLISVKYPNVTSSLEEGKAHAEGTDIVDDDKSHDTCQIAGTAPQSFDNQTAVMAAEEDAVPVSENSGALLEETCCCADDVTKTVGTHEPWECVFYNSLGGQKQCAVTVGAAVTCFDRSTSDEVIVTSDFCGCEQATQITYYSNKDSGTIAALTIYHTEEVVQVDCASATSQGNAATEGILKEAPSQIEKACLSCSDALQVVESWDESTKVGTFTFEGTTDIGERVQVSHESSKQGGMRIR